MIKQIETLEANQRAGAKLEEIQEMLSKDCKVKLDLLAHLLKKNRESESSQGDSELAEGHGEWNLGKLFNLAGIRIDMDMMAILRSRETALQGAWSSGNFTLAAWPRTFEQSSMAMLLGWTGELSRWSGLVIQSSSADSGQGVGWLNVTCLAWHDDFLYIVRSATPMMQWCRWHVSLQTLEWALLSSFLIAGNGVNGRFLRGTASIAYFSYALWFMTHFESSFYPLHACDRCPPAKGQHMTLMTWCVFSCWVLRPSTSPFPPGRLNHQEQMHVIHQERARSRTRALQWV